MSNGELSSEKLIFQAANNIFLLYGYHGTTLHQIALQAGVHKSAIHYYYRSKEKLYAKVVIFVLDNFFKTDINVIAKQEIIGKQKWFLYTELYNNQNRFERTLKELYIYDWDKKINEIKELLNI